MFVFIDVEYRVQTNASRGSKSHDKQIYRAINSGFLVLFVRTKTTTIVQSPAAWHIISEDDYLINFIYVMFSIAIEMVDQTQS